MTEVVPATVWNRLFQPLSEEAVALVLKQAAVSATCFAAGSKPSKLKVPLVYADY